MMEFALWTGLREGEMFNWELIDLRVDDTNPEVIVRFGGKGEPPKNGKIRQVPLFGRGLAAAKRWLELLPSYAPSNPEKLACPGRRGGRRSPGKNFHTTRTIIDKKGKKKAVKVDVFRERLVVAGIEATKRHDGRLPRWHDLHAAPTSAERVGHRSDLHVSKGHAKVTPGSALARNYLISLSGSTGTRTPDQRVKSPHGSGTISRC